MRTAEDVGLGGSGDLEGGNLLLLLVLVSRVGGRKGRVEHAGVFVAAVEVEHLLRIKLEAGALGFADHPNEWRMAECGFGGIVKGPSAA